MDVTEKIRVGLHKRNYYRCSEISNDSRVYRHFRDKCDVKHRKFRSP